MDESVTTAKPRFEFIDVTRIKTEPVDVLDEDPLALSKKDLQNIPKLTCLIKTEKKDVGDGRESCWAREDSQACEKTTIKEEPPDQNEELEIAVRYDELDFDEEDSNSSAEGPPQDIAYICRKCGCTFYTSSIGEYYFCPDCKPPVPSSSPQKQYAKYTCTNCGIQFYSTLGNWSECNSCAAKSASISKSNQISGIIYGVNNAYAKYKCRVCSCDFYSTVGEWYYCSKCISSSSSSRYKTKLNKQLQNPPVKYILYSCKMCEKPFYSSLTECYYCFCCSSSNSVRKKRSKNNTVANEPVQVNEVDKEEEKSTEVTYAKYTCKVCGKQFYSSIGHWDFCSDCNPETQLPDNLGIKTSKEINFFVRKNIVFNKYKCKLCGKSYFSSRDDEDHCKKCRKELHATQIKKDQAQPRQKQKPQKQQSVEEETSSCEEVDEWSNIIYAKYDCVKCGKPFYSRVGEYYFCGDCNPETKVTVVREKKNFSCAHCPFQTHLKRILRQHLLQIPKGRKKRCSCSVCFDTAELADGEENIEAVLYQCKKCDYTTRHKKRYKRHKIVVHKGNMPLHYCPHCKFRSSHRGRLRVHIADKHSNEKSYVCNECIYATRQKSRFLTHIAVIHQGEKPYTCSHCGDKFCTKKQLNGHLSQVHSRYTHYECADCSFSTNRKAYLLAHINSTHSQRQRLFCNLCLYSCFSKNRMSIHIKNAHERPYACSICAYSTCQKGRFTSHMLIYHKVSESLECELCSFKAERGSLLKRHMIEEHSRASTGKPYLKCDYCEYVTAQPGRLRNHVRLLHSKKRKKHKSKHVIKPENNKPSSDYSESTTNNHQETTSNEPNVKFLDKFYECSECSFKAKARKILRDHIVYSH